LHMIIYSANTYFWRRFKINYPFIFGFKEGTELGYREVFLLSTGLAILSLAAVLSNLDMEMDQRTKSFSAFTELVPLGLVIVSCKSISISNFNHLLYFLTDILEKRKSMPIKGLNSFNELQLGSNCLGKLEIES
jgi:hypothetical protein